MKLHYREYGRYDDRRPTLILLHGLLGSSANWHGIARRLEAEHHLLVPDLRNHGRSPHADEMGYPEMAGDLLQLVDEQGLDQALFIGHSMGGKVAMWLALAEVERVSGLVVVDIAPVAYHHSFAPIIGAMRAVDLQRLESRQAADEILAQHLPDLGLRQYLLQNLALENRRWRWRVNLSAIESAMPSILDFPLPGHNSSYPGQTLFLYGSESDYVQPGHEARIRSLFPYARLRVVSGAGHWLYAQRPEQFVSAVAAFVSTATH